MLIRESPKPEDFELAFDHSLARINKMATCDRVAVEKQEGPIAEAVNSLVRQTKLTKVATSARSLVAGADILLDDVGFRCFDGMDGFAAIARRGGACGKE